MADASAAPQQQVPTWDQISDDPEFQKLPTEKQLAAKEDYFGSVVLPGIRDYTHSKDDPYTRNHEWAKAAPVGGYRTQLAPDQEAEFQGWAKQNKVPVDDGPKADYDMRGFYQALKAGDKKATTAVDKNDGRLHFPDYWKTPYHRTFSGESQWATPDAPKWKNNTELVGKDGKVLFDDKLGMNPEVAQRAYDDFMAYKPIEVPALEAGSKAALSAGETLGADVKRAGGVFQEPVEPEKLPEDSQAIAKTFVIATGKQPTDEQISAAVERNKAENARRRAEYNQQLSANDVRFQRADELAEDARQDAVQPGEHTSLLGKFASILGSAIPGFADAPFSAQRKAAEVLQSGGSARDALKAAAIEAPLSALEMEAPIRGGSFAGFLARRTPRAVQIGAKALGGGLASTATLPVRTAIESATTPAGQKPRSALPTEQEAEEAFGAGAIFGATAHSNLRAQQLGGLERALNRAKDGEQKAAAARNLADFHADSAAADKLAAQAEQEPDRHKKADLLRQAKAIDPAFRRFAALPKAGPKRSAIQALSGEEPPAGEPPAAAAEPPAAPKPPEPAAAAEPGDTDLIDLERHGEPPAPDLTRRDLPAAEQEPAAPVQPQAGVAPPQPGSEAPVAQQPRQSEATAAPEAPQREAAPAPTVDPKKINIAPEGTESAAESADAPRGTIGETRNKDGLPIRTGENVGLAAAMSEDGRTSLHDKNMPATVDAAHTDPQTGAKTTKPFSLLESRDYHERIEDAEMQAGKDYYEAHRVATEAEHARARQLGFDPNELERLQAPHIDVAAHEARARGNTTPEAGTEPYRGSGEAGMRQDGAAPDNRFVLDRHGARYTEPVHGKLLQTIEAVTAKADGGGYAVLDPNSGKVLAQGETREAADAAANDMAVKAGRKRLKARLEKEPQLSQQQLRHQFQDRYPEARIGAEATTAGPQEKEDAADQEGRQDQARDEEGVRREEGREGVLRQREQGNDQGRGQEAVAPAPRRRRAPLDDPRIQAPLHRAELQRMADNAGWAQIGGQMIRDTSGVRGGESDNFGAMLHGQGDVVGRTAWVPNEPWFGGIQRDAGLPGNKEGRATRAAVRKALAGEPMTVRETRHIQALLDEIDARNTESAAFHEEGVNPTEQDMADAAAVQHAVGIDEGAVERAAVQFEDDRAGFMDAIRRINDGHAEGIKESDARPAGEGGEARPGDEGGAVQAAGDRPAADTEDRPSAGGSGERPAGAEPGAAGEFNLEGHTTADLEARDAAQRGAAADEQRRVAEEAARAKADTEAKDFRLTGSNATADVAMAGGQRLLLSQEEGGKAGKDTPAQRAKAAEPQSIADLEKRLSRAYGKPVKVERVPPPTRADRSIAAAVKRMFGRDVVFIKTDAPFHGVHIGGNKLFVNTETDRPHAQIIGHEFLHSLREERPELYNELMTALSKSLKGDQAAAFKARIAELNRKRGLPQQRADALHEELLAEVVGDQFADPAFLRELQKNLEPNVLRRVLAHLSEFLERARAAFGEDITGKGRQVQRFVQDIEAAQKAIREVLQKMPEERGPEGEAAPAFAQRGRGEAKFSQDERNADPFYSALVRSTEQMKGAPKSADATAWKQWLDGAQRRGEFKQDERDWMGLDNWLEQQGGKVTREQMQDFVRANQVKVQEVTKGGSGAMSDELRDQLRMMYSNTPPQDAAGFLEASQDLERMAQRMQRSGEQRQAERYFSMAAEANQLAENLQTDSGREAGATKYGQYQLPGGENYREVLLTLPAKDMVTREPAKAQPGWGDTDGGDVGYVEHGNTGADFRSGHWDEPNVVAHVRLNDRTGPNGEKILHVEEVQSDWHQKGRKEGYKAEPMPVGNPETYKVAQDEYQWHVTDPASGRTVSPGRGTVADEADARAYAKRYFDSLAKDQGGSEYVKVPDAPFKTTWPLLAMKRVIRMAAESGSSAWREATKPEGLREKAKKILGSELYSATPLKPMDGVMMDGLQNDKIRREIVKAIPVDVVDILSKNGFTADQFARNPNVVGKDLPVDSRTTVTRGMLDAMELVGARLRTALQRVLSSESARGDGELLPTIRASDLDPRIVSGLLSPSRLYGGDEVSRDMSGPRLSRTGPGTESSSISSPQSELAGVGRELGTTELAQALNRHDSIVSGNMDQLNKFDPGYSRISWTPGEKQADRYDLSKQISRVTLHDNSSGGLGKPRMEGPFESGMVRAYDHDGKEVISKYVHGQDKLAELIGKEAAEKLVNQSPRESSSAGIGMREKMLQGLDLKVGGEGMKGFYDKILPAEVGKYIKKWGGKVEQHEIPDADEYYATRDGNDHVVASLRDGGDVVVSRHDSAEEAQDAAKAANALRVPGFDITEKMRSSAMEGQPLFSQKDEPATDPVEMRSPEARAKQAGNLAPAFDPLNEEAARAVGRGSIGHAYAVLNRISTQVERALKGWRDEFDRISATPEGQEAINKAIHQWETGKPVDVVATVKNPLSGQTRRVNVAPFFRSMKEAFDQRVQAIVATGREMGYLDNYFPHLYEDPKGAKKWMQDYLGERPLEGGKGWTKQRFYETLEAARQAGLKPLSQNPADMVQAHLRQLDKYLALHQIRTDLEARNFVRDDDPQALRKPAGWDTVNDPAFRGKLVPSLIARDLNTILGPSLNNSAAFRAFRKAENSLVSAALGLSGFHATMTTGDTIASHIGDAVQRAAIGDIAGAAKSLGAAVVSPVVSPIKGKALMMQSLGETPNGKLTGLLGMNKPADAQTAALLRMLEEGGHQIRMSPTELNDSATKLMRMFRSGEYRKGLKGGAKTAAEAGHAILENITPLIHKHLVPAQKMTAKVLGLKFELDALADKLRDAEGNQVRRGDYAAIEKALTPDAIRQIAGRVVRQVDDRLGQMNYRNLYINRYSRDLMQAAFMSPGWQIGTLRTIGGGLKDIAKLARGGDVVHGPLDRYGEVTDAKLNKLTSRTAYLIGLHTLVLGLSAGITYALTGQGPGTDIRNYYTIRTGRKNPDGTDERLSFPSYLRDEVDLLHGGNVPKNLWHMLGNKINPVFRVMSELGHDDGGRDYFGNRIYDPDAGLPEQAKQIGKYLATVAMPFSVEGIRRSREAGAGPGTIAANLLGINPAPHYMTSTPFFDYLKTHKDDHGKSVLNPDQAQDRQKFFNALNQLRSGQEPDLQGLSDKDVKKLARYAATAAPEAQFKRLSLVQKMRAWSHATDEERAQYHLQDDILSHNLGTQLGKLNDEERAEVEPVLAQVEKWEPKAGTQVAGKGIPEAQQKALERAQARRIDAAYTGGEAQPAR